MGSLVNDPLQISWTGLKRYEDCHQRQLRTIQGKSSKTADGRVFLPGSVCDRSMRKWLESDSPQPGQMVEYVDEFLDYFENEDSQYVIKWRGNPNEDRRKVRDFCHKVVSELEPILLRKVIPYRYQPEVRFRVPANIPGLDGEPRQVLLIGGIDIAVLDDEDNFELIDLKSTADESYVRKGILGQLTFYSLAWGQYVGQRDQPKRACFVLPACKQKIVPVEVGVEERRMMLSRIVAYAHGAWREQWEPNPGGQCGWCDVKGSCDHFKTPISVDPSGRRRASFVELAESRRKTRGG